MYKKKRLPKLPKNLLLAHAGFLVATILWAFAGPIIKLTLDFIPPITFLFLRFLLVCLIILPYAFFELRRNPIHKQDWLNLFLLGIFSQTSIVIVFFALKYTSALDYAIISVLSLILSIYAGHYFYKEEVNIKLTTGLIIASLGTLVVVLEPIITGMANHSPIFQRLTGNLIGLLYALTWVVYIVWSKYSMGENSPKLKKALSFIHLKPMKHSYSPTSIVIISFFVGLITITPLAILENLGTFGSLGTFNIFEIPLTGWLGILYMVIFSSLIAYTIYQWALENGKVSDSALYGYLSPVFTLPAAYFLLGETPNCCMLVGGALIAVGVFIAETGNTNHDHN